MTNQNETFLSSPLQNFEAADTATGLQDGFLSERPFCSKITLRGDSGDPAFLTALKGMSLTLPLEANTVAHNPGATVFWMGPDEWLLHSATPVTDLGDQLREACRDLHTAVVDVSDYYTVIRIQTEHAREILARSCPFDLHGRGFNTGRCAQTKVGNAPCLLHAVDESGSVDVQVRWSYAEYLWLLLATGARSITF